MRRPFFLSLGLLTLLLSLNRLSATWMDYLLDTASQGQVRIAAAEGSFWNGKGVLSSRRRDGSLEPWQPVGWRLGLGAPWRGEVILTLDETRGVGHGRVVLSPAGWQLEKLSLNLPLPLLTAAMSNSAARVGWRGDAVITANSFWADWHGKCEGRAELLWQRASVDVVPGMVFGDYRMQLEGSRGLLHLALSTADGGLLKLKGEGTPQGFDGRIDGPPDLVSQLPAITAPYVRAGDMPGRATIRLN